MELDQMWQSALNEIQTQLPQATYATWIKGSRLIDRKDGVFYISVPNAFAKTWIEDKYHKNLLGILRGMDGSVRKVELVVIKDGFINKRAAVEPSRFSINTGQIELDYQTNPETGLNPKYRLASYIVGPSNELAFAAAEAIIDSVGKKYNPFFIYGGVGLGKTHLIQAIGNEVLAKYSGRVKPRYIPSEQFARDVFWGIRNKRMEDIKRKYRGVDMLIIDDIQFIGGKDKTEEEFFHTFNALYETNKQIIISSDKPPHDLPILQERLRSRFEGGFVADISYPEFEVRVAIIKSKLNEVNRQLDDESVDFIAQKLKRNIRELEGILKKVLLIQERDPRGVGKAVIEDIIDKSTQRSSVHVDADKILKMVAEFFNISIDDLISHSRRKEVVQPRQIAMYLLRDISDLSYPNIGEKMGRDHTTAIHSYEKINAEINQNSTLNQKILTIKDLIYKG